MCSFSMQVARLPMGEFMRRTCHWSRLHILSMAPWMTVTPETVIHGAVSSPPSPQVVPLCLLTMDSQL